MNHKNKQAHELTGEWVKQWMNGVEDWMGVVSKHTAEVNIDKIGGKNWDMEDEVSMPR